ncbi:MAG TPA: hypothetical protein ACFCUD_00585 [Cyclobacteriaceae bacterium]
MRRDQLNISLAEQACSDAWHLNDWVFVERRKNNPKLTKENYRKQIYNDCPELKILHDIANSIKHKELSSPKVKIQSTRIQAGQYSSEYSKEYDTPRLEVYLENDTRIDVDDLVETAINYWDKEV